MCGRTYVGDFYLLQKFRVLERAIQVVRDYTASNHRDVKKNKTAK